MAVPTVDEVAAAQRAWAVYRFAFGFALYVGTATFTLSLIERVGAGPLALVATGTILEVCYTAAEVPTGVVADRYGRKPSILVGFVVIGLALLLDAVPVLGVVLAAQVLVGVGWTFTSGADVAWLTDEVGEEAARPLYARGARHELRGSMVGLLLGTGLGLVNLWLPLVTAGASLLVAAAWLAGNMHETDRRQAHEERLGVRETVRAARTSVRSRPAVALLLLVMVTVGLGGEGVDRLWQLHLVGDDAGERSTVLVVGALFMAGLVLATALAGFVERRLDADHDGRWAQRGFAVGNLLVAASVALLAVAPWGVAAAGLVASHAVRHACYPLAQAMANRDADAASRATVNSMVTQAESVGEIGGGAFGPLAAWTSTGTTLVVSAAVFAVGAALPNWRERLRRSQTGGPEDTQAKT